MVQSVLFRILLAAALFAPAAFSGGDPEYVLTDLAVASGRSNFYRAVAINNRGEVAGIVIDAGPVFTCVVYDRGKLVEVATGCETAAINEPGDVAGVLSDNVHAFVRVKETLTDIGAGLPLSSHADGINNRRQVVGDFGLPPTGGTHAFLWQDGVLTDLGTLAPNRSDGFSNARAINERGQIVGTASLTATGPFRAFLWENGGMRDLGTLTGEASSQSEAWGINDRGQVVGRSSANPNPAQQSDVHAFLWTNGVMIDLGAPGVSVGLAINNSGQVVGEFWNEADRLPHAFVWDRGVFTELPGLGGGVTTAVSINNRGQIVGLARLPDGTSHAVMWQKRGRGR